MKRIAPKTSQGTADKFAGAVYPTCILEGDEPSRVRMYSVHFAPSAHTAWHAHAVGQYLHIVEGTALVQERGGEAQVLKPGETIYTALGVEHWHGATPDSFMVHLAIVEASAPDDNQIDTIWNEHVTDDEYALAASRAVSKN